MAISSVTNTSPTQAGKDPITGLSMSSNAGKQMLGADDFMKLLTTQLTSQDPMNPMKDTEFISQMANFTSLEQMRTLSKSFQTFTTDQKMSAAPAFLGRNVTVKDATGDVTGLVDSITLKDGRPAIVINGKSYDTNLITGITMPPPPAPAPISAAQSSVSAPNPQS
jgi:flagellar basal-body rod modification protein FlgD